MTSENFLQPFYTIFHDNTRESQRFQEESKQKLLHMTHLSSFRKKKNLRSTKNIKNSSTNHSRQAQTKKINCEKIRPDFRHFRQLSALSSVPKQKSVAENDSFVD